MLLGQWLRLMTWKFNAPYKQDHLIAKHINKLNMKKNKLISSNLNNKNAESKIKKTIYTSKKFIVKYLFIKRT